MIIGNIPQHINQLAKDSNFKPSIRIGKAGLGESLYSEIRDQLAAKNIVKIKINRGLFERSDRALIWQEICQQTDSILVLARGNVGVLWKN
ncbi:MAG: YhbY family RNA-binding protein [Euryarchaeota archaeon]|nr:YhbY family RNA-binding protein [Euryarchaeota archaeon]MBT3970745.1 YhbY family RNA-binding protein [Euryarchaeota archaeon]MBT4406617.1 YhbY family RNA-binding protein [Euryarchaeota archaeon]MBT6644768.1 YhbY family RNA-binding protein [Euryarchaeota archaeon]